MIYFTATRFCYIKIITLFRNLLF